MSYLPGPIGAPEGAAPLAPACTMATQMRAELRVALVALLAAGCGSSIDDKVLLSVVEAPVQIDTLCAGGSCADRGLTLRLGFDPEQYTGTTEVIAFEQYRVDYALDDSKLDLPYFAAPAAFELTGAGMTEVVLVPAGRTQRSALPERETVEGTGILQLAGYDSRDEPVVVEVDFELRFGALAPAAEETP